jgi:NAD(P)-dependent dehydrogenase (short-subunit alcohol dehydrogenase family)
MGRVEGRIALITGGASGIGRACAERLAEEGAVAVVTDIQDALGAEVVAAITAAGGRAEYHSHDVTDEDAWVRVIDAVVAAHGGLDILVNNAGIGIGGSIADMALAEWQRQQAINLDGVFLGIKHGIRAMRESGGGSIVNMSSVAGLKGSANLAAYNATKGGVRLFTKGVALECAQSGWNIRVNSVHPGIIDTPIWSKVNPDFLAEGENTVDIDAMAAMAVPMGRSGAPRNIADGVLFLASDDAAYVTGTELVIDGGLSA